jgi:predicted ATPase/DNA-binding SARP family transcriptional activator
MEEGTSRSQRPTAATLPASLTPFVGREPELAAIETQFEASRLVTLTGAGGAGKTRLALETATRLAKRFQHGVAWVELAALSEPSLVPAHVAATLGIGDESGRAPLQTIVDVLQHRELFLVLDNCEHVLGACAELAETILRACPGVRILATSREALGIEGERVIPVTGLVVGERGGDLSRVADTEAVRLFVDRAQATLPSFRLTSANAAAVAEICRRLDGLPLAIELAAARVRVLTPEQIASRLTDSFAVLMARSRGGPSRHQTLRATVDWSYQLLSRPERELLNALSIFAGGFTLDAIEAVWPADDDATASAIELLTSLVDKSLVVLRENNTGVEARYSLLELVRQYACDRLKENPSRWHRLRQRHADYFTTLAERALPQLERSSLADVLRLVPEHDNFRAVLGWTLHRDASAEERALGVRLTAALWWYWGGLGFNAEGIAWLDQAIAAMEDLPESEAMAMVLFGAGGLALVHGEVDRAPRLFERSLALWERLPGSHRHVMTRASYAYLLATTGDDAPARAHIERASALAEQMGIPWISAYARTLRALIESRIGDGARAEQLLDLAQQDAARSGYLMGVPEAGNQLAWLALERGDAAAASERIRSSLRATREVAEPLQSARTLVIAAGVARASGDASLAARLIGAVDELVDSRGGFLLPIPPEAYDELRKLVAAALKGSFVAENAIGRGMSILAAVDYALAHLPAPASDAWPGVDGSTSAGLPAPLSVLALGPLAMYRGGEAMPAEAWPYAKPRELLLYLLCNPAGRTRDQIGIVFWPEASATQVKNNFHVALHHIRKTLGAGEWIVFEGGKYRVAWESGVEFDAAAFEKLMPSAIRSAASGDETPLRKTLDLYRGDFLEETPVGDWHLDHRDKFRRLYVEGMLALAGALERSGENGEAARVYQKLVSRDPLNEAAYRHLMISLAADGRRGEAFDVYRRLVHALETELEATPEAETRALYFRLKQASSAASPSNSAV